MPYWTSIVISQAIGMAYGFVIFRAWAFAGFERRSVLLQIRDFLLVNLAGAITTIGVAIPLRNLLLAAFDAPVMADPAAHAIGIAAGAVVNYLGHKQYTFRAAR
ncbi:GtrA family protein [Methyloceanibacter sp.]|uniref:GtrA family protein n=1 Tax=Methyloceanibacter sp. TaxID=1965321 RepID=UPI003D6D6948